MKISESLLRKYFSGHCSPEEKLFIQQWITSTEDIESELSSEELSEMDKTTWENIQIINKESFANADNAFQRQMEDRDSTADTSVVLFKSKQTVKKIIRLSIAASLILGASYFVKYAGNLSSKEELQLVLSIPEQDKVAFVDQGCVVQFEGVLRLHNPTSSEKTIICNGKIYSLAAGEKYLIDSRFPNLKTPSMRMMREFIVNDFVRTDYYSKSSFHLGTC
ncbi:MAG: hypothetical protein AAF944_19985 [Bacteroidota bacterium]